MALPGASHAADASHPDVIELFQSQGCSSCPPANANVLKLAGRPDILALSFEVTYWDHLGWTDTFGSPRFTARQWQYARALGHDEVWTPQIVINGKLDVVGARPGEIEGALKQGGRAADGPAIVLSAGSVSISGSLPGKEADVWLVRYDPRVQRVAIHAGENDGLTLPHRNVVVELIHLGSYSGSSVQFALPEPSRAGLASAVLVQTERAGPILAVARSPAS